MFLLDRISTYFIEHDQATNLNENEMEDEKEEIGFLENEKNELNTTKSNTVMNHENGLENYTKPHSNNYDYTDQEEIVVEEEEKEKEEEEEEVEEKPLFLNTISTSRIVCCPKICFYCCLPLICCGLLCEVVTEVLCPCCFVKGEYSYRIRRYSRAKAYDILMEISCPCFVMCFCPIRRRKGRYVTVMDAKMKNSDEA